MTGSAWACAAVLCLHLSYVGALPKEVSPDQVRPYLTGEREVRVLLFGDADALYLRLEGGAAIEDLRTGARIASVQPGARVIARRSGDTALVTAPGLRTVRTRIRITPLAAESGVKISASGGWGRDGLYPGPLDIAVRPRGLQLVQHVHLEEYVSGVVAAEMPSYFPLEAMKAQAIAARTYALSHLGNHVADEADLCARVHCQAYAGCPASGSRAAQAARQTAGKILCWNGLLVDALYHSACGGSTATAWEVRQSKLLPYLRGSADAPYASPHGPAYCSYDHDVGWSRRYSLEQADRLVSSNLKVVLGDLALLPGRLEAFRLIRNDATGRAEWLKVYTTAGAYWVRGDAIRWLFGSGRPGPGGLRSTAFELIAERDAEGKPSAFVFRGVGHGHGIGLCQWGARGRALGGQTAETILSAYYPGIAVMDLRQ